MQHGLMLGDLTQDLRICLRGLLRAPMMTMTIVATVGLGIGATTVIFSAINAALLRPLPYVEPDRLAVSIFLLAAALVACCVPARRAVAVQPAAVLRNE